MFRAQRNPARTGKLLIEPHDFWGGVPRDVAWVDPRVTDGQTRDFVSDGMTRDMFVNGETRESFRREDPRRVFGREDPRNV